MAWASRGIGLVKTLHAAIGSRGGPGAVLGASLRVMRREGLGGLRRLLARAARVEDYGAWVRQFDTIDPRARERLRAEASRMAHRPLLSIVVPVFNTEENALRQMLDSVLAQIYPEWELCICDDASSVAHVRQILTAYAAKDPRIKVVYRRENGHICLASNDASALAQGRFLVLLDHDDVLPEHTLLVVARYLLRHPEARMLYSDEDKLDAKGQRVEPYFKSGWNPTLMLGQNLFSHLGVIETALFRETGGFRPGLEGSQDHDLALRCAERIAPGQIVHIPHVLYHWRMSATSTASGITAKTYVRDASLRAVRDHLARTGRDAQVDWLRTDASMIRVRFAVPTPAPLVSIVIPTRDRPDLLRQCIDSLLRHTRYPAYEIIIVDNGSTDPLARDLLERYARHDDITVLRVAEPFNFSALNNHAVEHARGALLCLMNNDVETRSHDWLDVLCGFAMQPDAGAVGPALWYPDERLQHGGVMLAGAAVAGHMHHLLHRNDPGYFCRAILAQEVSAVTAACLLVRKTLYEQAGGLDATHLRVAYNDVDFCLRLGEAGYRNIYVPYADLYHHESASRGSDATGDNATRRETEAEWMRRRWGAALENDRFHNPNLALAGGRFFDLAMPPRTSLFE
ncbi:MAG: glycosyltransferase family 2 protein [Janthinobacterium lividum]